MPIANVLLAVIVATTLDGTPESEIVEQPAPAAEPAPVSHQAPPSYQPPTRTGLGMMVAGPVTVAIGIPFSFLGNLAWRDNCGPTSSNRQCADGTLASLGAHTITAFAYTTGITLTGIGAARRGQYDAGQDPTRTGTGMVVGGAVLLPASLIGMGMVRLMLWLPTPECQTYDCVERTQNISTVAVGGLALTASIGAGLLMYGAAYNRARPKYYTPVAVLPQVGRSFAGIGFTGRF
jgi:hypothetical protein